MKKQIPAIVLALVCIILGLALSSAKQELAVLKKEKAAIKVCTHDQPVSSKTTEAIALKSTPSENIQPLEEAAIPEEEPASRRMMSSMAKMMDNPTMNKMMEASQRGAVGALYSDMIEYLKLDADETNFFMDLLMYRQMKQVDLSMKMMGGTLSEEEKTQIAADLKEAGETVKTEMEKFLNNPEDFSEFEFYEKTMGERMMLSQMDQQLAEADAALGDEAYRNLLSMMHEEKTDYEFTSDLNDDENMNLSAERFSKENIDRFASDMDALNDIMIQRAQSMLTPKQLTAFEEAIKTTTDMQKAQLEMASQMFGGGN